MPRVLVLPSFYPTADRPHTGIFFLEHVRMIRAAGWRADVVFVEPRSLRDMRLGAVAENHFQWTMLEEENGRTYRVHGWNPLAQTSLGGRTWARWLAGAVDRYVNECGLPDVIHAHNALWGGAAARLSAARHGIPYVVTEHSSAVLMGELTAWQASRARAVWTAAAATTAVGRQLAAAVHSLGVPVVGIIPNPVDTEFFVLPPEGIRVDGRRQFLAVANLNANKRIDLVLRAFARVAEADSTARLRVVGDGPLRAELEQAAGVLNIATRVHFSGAAGRNEIRAAMWEASCFVSASKFETFGIAVAEALATGLPVVSTRSGGPDDVVLDGMGILTPTDSVEHLAQSMLASPTVVGPRALERRGTITSRYSPTVVAEAYTEVYGRAARKRS